MNHKLIAVNISVNHAPYLVVPDYMLTDLDAVIDLNVINSSDIVSPGYKMIAANGRVLAIGDIHGSFEKLRDIIDKFEPQANDIIVFLGDYIDRGASNKKVALFIADLRKNYNVITLMGNHDHFMMQAYEGDSFAFEDWEDNGGIQALSEASPAFYASVLGGLFTEHDILSSSGNDKIPVTLIMSMLKDQGFMTSGFRITQKAVNNPGFFKDITMDLTGDVFDYEKVNAALKLKHCLNALPPFAYTVNMPQNYFFSHAGHNPLFSLQKQTLFSLIWTRDAYLNPDEVIEEIDEVYLNGYKSLIGHSTVIDLIKDGDYSFDYSSVNRPIFTKRYINLDTKAYSTGPLSGYDITNDLIYQSFTGRSN